MTCVHKYLAVIAALMMAGETIAAGTEVVQLLSAGSARAKKVFALNQHPELIAGELRGIYNPEIHAAVGSYCPKGVASCYVIRFEASIVKDRDGKEMRIGNVLSGVFESKIQAETWIDAVEHSLRYRDKMLAVGKSKEGVERYLNYAAKVRVYVTEPMDVSQELRCSWARSVNLLYRLMDSTSFLLTPPDLEREKPRLVRLPLPEVLPQYVFMNVASFANDLIVIADKKVVRPVQKGLSPVILARSNDGGTGVSNGGGDGTSRGWTAVGFGALKVKSSYNIESFLDKHPVVMEVCSNRKDVLFPPIPESVADKIVITRNGKPLSMKEVCFWGSLASAYQSLAFTLNNVHESAIFKHLVKRTLQVDNNPIVVRLDMLRRSVSAKGGWIEEFAWFDPANGQIHWAPQKNEAQMLIALMTQRTNEAALMHELMHVLTFRRLGGYQKQAAWHDVRFPIRETEHQGGLVISGESNIYRFQTSPYAAGIESLSNIIEAPFGFHHALVDDISLGLFHYSKKLGRYEAYKDPRFGMKREELLANEAFLTNMLDSFVGRVAYSESDNTVYAIADEKIIKGIIDAVSALPASSDIIEVLKKYDQQSNSNEGWRLVREYLLYDYKTCRDIRNDFDYMSNPERFRFGKYGDTVVVTNEQISGDSLFTPLMDELKNAEYAKQKQQPEKAAK